MIKVINKYRLKTLRMEKKLIAQRNRQEINIRSHVFVKLPVPINSSILKTNVYFFFSFCSIVQKIMERTVGIGQIYNGCLMYWSIGSFVYRIFEVYMYS